MKSPLQISIVALCILLSMSWAVAAFSERQDPLPTGKIFEGQLTKVDATAKSFSARADGPVEMAFEYTAETEIIVPDKSIKGLADKTGQWLRISYSDHAGKNIATRIELLDKGFAAPRP